MEVDKLGTMSNIYLFRCFLLPRCSKCGGVAEISIRYYRKLYFFCPKCKIKEVGEDCIKI